MKKALLSLLALGCALALAGCGEAPAASSAPAESAPPAAQAAPAVPRPTPDTPYPERRSQQELQAVYEEILEGIGCAWVPSYSAVHQEIPYPPEWGDAYLDCGLLHVNLAGDTPELEERYRGYVSDPGALVFHDVDYSYKELEELQNKLAHSWVEGWSAIGVNVIANRVDVTVTEFSGQFNDVLDALAEEYGTDDLYRMVAFVPGGAVTPA